MLTLIKRLNEANLIYDYDFVTFSEIIEGDTLAAVLSVTVTESNPATAAPLSLSDPTFLGTKVFVTVSGGDEWASYKLEFKVLTAGGATLVGLGKLFVRDDQ